MKVFYKKHFIEGENVWIVVHFDKPIRNSDNKLCDGRVSIQIGKAEHIKARYSMSMDECRSLIDALKNAVKTNDELLTSLLNPPEEVETYDKQEPIEQEPEYAPQGDFKLFESGEEEKPKTKVYY